MKNYIQPGDMLTVTAPSNLASGAGVLIGSIFGVAANAALSGASMEMAVKGVFDLVKVGTQAWTVGQLVYWTGTACTNVASTNKLIGVAVLATGAGAGETIGRVRLNAAGITP